MSFEPTPQQNDTSMLPSTASAKNVVVQPYIVWENGKPVRQYKTMLIKDDVQNMKMHAAQQIYHGDWDPVTQEYIPDGRYEGLTKIEVAQHKLMDKAAAGDTQALQQIENRILGMPKQQVESLNINATLEAFLEQVGKSEGMVPHTDDLSSGDFIEGEVVGYSSSAEPENKGLDI